MLLFSLVNAVNVIPKLTLTPKSMYFFTNWDALKNSKALCKKQLNFFPLNKFKGSLSIAVSVLK